MKYYKQILKLYTIDELKEDYPNIYRNVLNKTRDEYIFKFYEFQCNDFLNSMNKWCENFNHNLNYYNIDVEFDYFDIKIANDENQNDYMNLTNFEKINLIKYFNHLLDNALNDSGFELPFSKFTGYYTDYYIFEYFKRNNIKELSFNNFHKEFKNAITYAFKIFVHEEYKTFHDDKEIIELEELSKIYFDDKGVFYNVDNLKELTEIA